MMKSAMVSTKGRFKMDGSGLYVVKNDLSNTLTIELIVDHKTISWKTVELNGVWRKPIDAAEEYKNAFERYKGIMDKIETLVPALGFDILSKKINELKTKYGDNAVPEEELIALLDSLKKDDQIIDVETDPSATVTPGQILFEAYQERMGFHEVWQERNDQVKDAYEYAAEALKDYWNS